MSAKRQVRYPSRLAIDARRLADAGWDAPEIRRILTREHGLDIPPSLEIVRTWADPDYAQRRKRANSAQKRASRRARGVTWMPQMANADTKLHRIVVLSRDVGLGYRPIVRLMAVDYGVALTAYEVRQYLLHGTVPRALRERVVA